MSNEKVCKRCGVAGVPVEGPPTPPHGNKLNCSECGHFMGWKPKLTPEERAAAAAKYSRNTGDGCPPSQKQIDFLMDLGFEGEGPATMLLTSQAIQSLLDGDDEDTSARTLLAEDHKRAWEFSAITGT